VAPELARAYSAEGGSASHAQLAGVAAVVDLVQHCSTALHAPPSGNRNGGGAPLVDPRRVFLCGHGAGGALALEAAIELAQLGTPAAAVVMLDALPWPRTVVRAGSEFFVDLTLLISLRGEPSALWNGGGAALGVLRAPRIAAGSGATVCDVLIRGARHCDFVRDSGGALAGCLLSLVGLAGPKAGADAADELLLAIALDAPSVGGTAPVLAQLARFCASADSLEASGAARRGGGGLV
jgi:pimeloyl-ACP methyl ester carboxylesterase